MLLYYNELNLLNRLKLKNSARWWCSKGLNTMVDFNTLFNTRNASTRKVELGKVELNDTLAHFNAQDVKGFDACLYAYDNGTLYFKMVKGTPKGKHSAIKHDNASVRLNGLKLELGKNARKVYDLEPVKAQDNTYKVELKK